jgi:hypothetical protein
MPLTHLREEVLVVRNTPRFSSHRAAVQEISRRGLSERSERYPRSGRSRAWLLLLLLLLLPSVADAQPGSQRFEASGHFTYIFLRQIGSRDAGPGTEALGIGGRITYYVTRHIDLEGDLIFQPNAGVQGYRVQGLFGAKAGFRFDRFGLFAKVRPGFLYFSKDPFGVGGPASTPLGSRWASSMERSIDLGGVVEYYTARGLIVRFDLGDTIVNYEPRTVVPSSFQPPISAGGFTTDNWQASFGLGFRF